MSKTLSGATVLPFERKQASVHVLPPYASTARGGYSELLESIVRSSDDAIITKNLDSIITSWNPAATVIFGYEPEEIIGQSILTLIPSRLRHEETEVIARLRRGEQIAHFETTRVTKSGREIQVSLTISPLRDEKGQVFGASKIARNITRDRALDRARLQLAAIVENSEDAIISKSLDGIILSWNTAAARLFGYAEDEIVGRSILTLIPDDLHHEEPGIIAKLVAGQRIEHFETTRVTKNGERLQVALTISPIRDENGAVIGASKILRDISERKRLEASLLQAEKLAATGRMAASIAHEINNPLEGLLNLIYLARTGADKPDEVRSLLATAEGELARVSHIAKQTLGYYRQQAAPTAFSLNTLIDDALIVYGPRLRSAGIEVTTRLEHTPAFVGKCGEIMQAISNIIANSIHAMPEGGKLEITLARDPERRVLRLDISDTGPGIPEENRTKIFEPFFTTRSAIGTGIGLWVSRKFIEEHGGTLTLLDRPGTTMRIELPAAPRVN